MSHLTTEILGVPVAQATYESANAEIERLASEPRPSAVSACNTHLVSTARRNPFFRRILSKFDLIVPDGTPLVWLLNSRGAKLNDRVYGPYLMRYVLEHAPAGSRHYFFGGSETCLAALKNVARALNPGIEIAGTLSPPFGKWTEAQNAEYAAEIRRSGANYIWVALGGVRQERWIIENQHRFDRGVFLAVGDAFELVAGNRPFAPKWMQRAGLTWLYRLLQEPRRLWPRYVKHNSLFMVQVLGELLGVKAAPLPEGSRIRIAFIGARGVPARYAGFETVVEQLGARLAERGHTVTVYNRSPLYTEQPETYRGMRLLYFPTVRTKFLETIVHTLFCVIHALTHSYDLIYICGVGNACHAWPLRIMGRKVIINVDGIDYKRSKWSGFARWWLWRSERWATQLCDNVIADNLQVVRHYKQVHGFDAEYIAYGAITNHPKANAGMLEKWNLQPQGYVLCVSRLSPENEIDLLVRAHARAGGDIPLVIVGPYGYERNYYAKLRRLAGNNVHFTGAQYGEAYRELSQNCRFFVLPAAIEATRLVLLDQMGFGNAILYKNSPATIEVIGDAGQPFPAENAEQGLASLLKELWNDPARCAALGSKARERAEACFNWERVADQYEALFRRFGFFGKPVNATEHAPA
jgi:N-acetylglucosaminyldiphosphoundecaprenol N-acetyl-beta-D-mannosaminyltransferase